MSDKESAVPERKKPENKISSQRRNKASVPRVASNMKSKSNVAAAAKHPGDTVKPDLDRTLLNRNATSAMRAEVTSKSLAGPSELLMVMPLRQGFVDCLSTRTYKGRVKKVAEVFSDLRVNSRESSLTRPFSDIVDRVRTIYSVHIAVLEPDKLLLGVAFDRPWEPYIRIVWRHLGALLDPILCNCEGYSGIHSSDQGFEQFAHWIRKYQINADTYYLVGNHTVSDILYLDQIEKIYRGNSCPAEADQAVARHIVRTPEELASEQRPSADGPEMTDFIKLGVKAITAFHLLTHIYPKQSDDHAYLYEAARVALKEFPASDTWPESAKLLKELFRTEIEWFEHDAELQSATLPTPEPVSLPRKFLQGGILEAYDANVGCLLMLRIIDPVRARKFISRFRKQVTTAAKNAPGADGVYRNVAFTLSGIVNLDVSAAEINAFPKEFREGMESRAGLLGDLRTNHPDEWSLPEQNWRAPSKRGGEIDRVSLDTVDVVIQLRIRTKKAGSLSRTWSTKHALFPAVRALVKDAAGLELLAVQPMYSKEDKKEHFGFRDGLSQPFVAPKENQHVRDEISAGEVFLGYENDHKDFPRHADSPLRRNGTFLIIRSLDQNVEALNAFALRQSNALNGALDPEQVMAKMMGRTREGVPLVKTKSETAHNDFDYKGDLQGEQCPLHAHIRRTQPRDGTDDTKVPRIIRRGMSYGPSSDEDKSAARGMIFQAYNASIAEQFEVVQRWISGGNSTGTYSRQSDPLLGVPQLGEDRIVTIPQEDNKPVIRFNMGQDQFVTLNWGCYLFVPSLEALQELSKPPRPKQDDETELGKEIIARLQQQADENESEARDGWKQLLEERDSLDEGDHHAVWRAIRQHHNGVLRTPFGVLVGNADLVSQVLKDPAHFVADEYNKRLNRCIGENYLGLNPPEHDEEAEIPNRVISAVSSEQAFVVAHYVAKRALQALENIPGDLNIPLPKYVDLVLSAIAKHWFGIPDGPTILDMLNKENPPEALAQAIASAAVLAGGEPAQYAQTSHCPYHFTSPSRFVFQPQPSAEVAKFATVEGNRLRDRVRSYVQKERKAGLKELAGELNNQLSATVSNESFASILLGALLGFMPTVQGNFITTMREWIRSRELWRVQQIYMDGLQKMASGKNEAKATHPSWPAAQAYLLPYLERTMAARPIPAMVHRKVAESIELGTEHLKVGDQVVLGLVSAAAEHDGKETWPVFGGDYYEEGKATHACPGRRMAMGTLLGMIGAFLELEGTLRPTPSSFALTLQRDT